MAAVGDRHVLRPWEEAVGVVEELSEDALSLSLSRTIVLRLDGGELGRLKRKLRKGAVVGVLMTEDGDVRVRSVGGQEIEGLRGEVDASP